MDASKELIERTVDKAARINVLLDLISDSNKHAKETPDPRYDERGMEELTDDQTDAVNCITSYLSRTKEDMQQLDEQLSERRARLEQICQRQDVLQGKLGISESAESATTALPEHIDRLFSMMQRRTDHTLADTVAHPDPNLRCFGEKLTETEMEEKKHQLLAKYSQQIDEQCAASELSHGEASTKTPSFLEIVRKFNIRTNTTDSSLITSTGTKSAAAATSETFVTNEVLAKSARLLSETANTSDGFVRPAPPTIRVIPVTAKIVKNDTNDQMANLSLEDIKNRFNINNIPSQPHLVNKPVEPPMSILDMNTPQLKSITQQRQVCSNHATKDEELLDLGMDSPKTPEQKKKNPFFANFRS